MLFTRGYSKKTNQEELVSTSSSQYLDNTKKYTITEIIDSLFEQACYIGMTPHDYWYEDPNWFWVMRETHNKRMREDIDKMNYNSWLGGLYIMYAIGSCFSKNTRYPSEPLNLGNDNKIIDEDEKKKIEAKKVVKTYNNLKNWSSSFKGKFSKDTKK